jgi:hypothetical protein
MSLNGNLKLIMILSASMLVSCSTFQDQFQFEKLTLHTNGNGCEGHCSTYHLQIDKNKQILYYGEKVYKLVDSLELVYDPKDSSIIKYSRNLYSLHDSSRIGYFSGIISDSLYSKMVTRLEILGLDSLRTNGKECCDGVHKRLRVFYNNKQKYWESTFPNDSLQVLFNILNEVALKSNLKRSNKTFEIL